MAGKAEMHLLDPETEGVRARAFSITDDWGGLAVAHDTP